MDIYKSSHLFLNFYLLLRIHFLGPVCLEDICDYWSGRYLRISNVVPPATFINAQRSWSKLCPNYVKVDYMNYISLFQSIFWKLYISSNVENYASQKGQSTKLNHGKITNQIRILRGTITARSQEFPNSKKFHHKCLQTTTTATEVQFPETNRHYTL